MNDKELKKIDSNIKKIEFKSLIKNFKTQEVQNSIEFVSHITDAGFEENYNFCVFEEIRNGEKITNRFEFNNEFLKIFSGVSSLVCELNNVVKNDYVVNVASIERIFLYTKMTKMEIDDFYNLKFIYLISSHDDFENEVTQEIELILKLS